MDILLYNPLSRNGKNEKFINKIIESLRKTGNAVVSYSILAIDDVEAFASGCNADDRIIIVGGDGTINHLANRIYDLDIKQDLYMYQAGTGNDFIRSLKTKDKIVPIKKYIRRLPSVHFHEKSRYFLNGTGAGLDGFIGHLVNTSRFKKNKINYFRHAFEGFAKFKPISAEITLNGMTWREEKLWFTSMMNGAYYGGGMKIAPKAHRNVKELYLVVVKNVPKWVLMLIFPTIYLGWHVMFKKWVQVYKSSEITVKFDKPTYLQIDGDVEYPVDTITVKAYE
ncbi:MAG: diacylglycerol kinase family protein [Acholeplasmataceae bacterium]|nr:diacylglycerol kinase family protein [Acholeplasmataceae bacterium]